MSAWNACEWVASDEYDRGGRHVLGALSPDSFAINPASCLPMVGGIGGVDLVNEILKRMGLLVSIKKYVLFLPFLRDNYADDSEIAMQNFAPSIFINEIACSITRPSQFSKIHQIRTYRQ